MGGGAAKTPSGLLILIKESHYRGPPLIPTLLQHTGRAPSPKCPTHWRVPVIIKVMLDAVGEPVASDRIVEVSFLLGGLSGEPVASSSHL